MTASRTLTGRILAARFSIQRDSEALRLRIAVAQRLAMLRSMYRWAA